MSQNSGYQNILKRSMCLSKIDTTNLSICAVFHNGRGYDSNEFGAIGDVYIAKIGDVTQKRDYKSWEMISRAHFESLRGSFLKNKDILMTLTGDPPDVGKVEYILNIPENSLSWNQRVALIRYKKNGKIHNPEYLYAALLCKYCRDHIERWAKGIRQRNVGNPAVLEMLVPITSATFQEEISNLIKTSFNKLNDSRKQYTEAEQILLSELGLLDWKPRHQLSFIRDFSDTKTAERIDAEYYQPQYEKMVKAIKSVKDYDILDNIITPKKCFEPGSEAYQDSGIPFTRVSNLSKFGINDNNQQFISEDLYESLKQHQPKKGEILLSKDATPGIAYYLKDEPKKMIPSSGVLRLTVKDTKRTYPEYLTLVLNSVIVQKQIERDVGGSILNHWLVDQVKNTLIPILSDSIQKEISKKIDESFFAREKSKRLLEIAKQGVEMAIEKDETKAQNWINSELKKLNITLKES